MCLAELKSLLFVLYVAVLLARFPALLLLTLDWYTTFFLLSIIPNPLGSLFMYSPKLAP